MEEFFRDLAATRDEYGWYLTDDTGRDRIRCLFKAKNQLMCPITAVMYLQCPVTFPFLGDVMITKIGRTLGLSESERKTILVSADGYTQHESYDSAIRKRLLDTLGLQEHTGV